MPIRRQYQPIGSIVTNVTGARAIGGIYQNTSGSPILVLCTVGCFKPAVGDTATVIAYVENVTPPTIYQSGVGETVFAASLASTTFSFTFAVPSGFYYQLVETIVGTGTTLLINVIEVQLIAPFSAGF